MKIKKRAIFGVLALLVAFFGGRALWHALSVESSFDLAPDSRLPKWLTISPRMSRSDVAVTMDYYSGPSGRTATFTLRNARTGKTITTVNGTLKGSGPIYLDHTGPPDTYPSYEIITVRKTTEVIEHRKMEPIFYVTDDPSALSKLGLPK